MHAKLNPKSGPLVYLTIFDTMSTHYDVMDNILEWLTSPSPPTRKIAQNLLYRGITADLNWIGIRFWLTTLLMFTRYLN